jgi:hypothetical protein
LNPNHSQYSEETILMLLRKIFSEPRFLKIKLIILTSGILSLITIFYNSILFSCQLALIQNALLVYIVTSMLFSINKMQGRGKRIKLGVPIAAVFGAFPASITILLSNIQYYFFGFRDLAYSAKGLVAPPITSQMLLVELGSQIGSWLMLIAISAIAGFIASIVGSKNQSN